MLGVLRLFIADLLPLLMALLLLRNDDDCQLALDLLADEHRRSPGRAVSS
jgi:hypothetical protein